MLRNGKLRFGWETLFTRPQVLAVVDLSASTEHGSNFPLKKRSIA
jgi:hypothetical protein